MKIIFMGTPVFSLPTLKGLYSSHHDLIAVVTQPDRPRGRGNKIQPTPVKSFALSKDITVFQPENANTDKEFIRNLKDLNPDIMVVIAYGQILSEQILNIPQKNCINVHASLLPKYRGAAPINWVIMNNEKKTGVTIMKMDKGMDTGDIILRKTITINPEDNALSLHDNLSELGQETVLTSLKLIENGTASYQPQQHHIATYAPMLKKKDGLINWNEDAEKIFYKIKGLIPWPCAFTFFKDNMIKIWKADLLSSEKNAQPGKITINGKEILEVETGHGKIRIKEIQMQGRQRMKIKQFIQGNIIKSGDIFNTLI